MTSLGKELGSCCLFKDWIRSTHGMIWFTRHKPAWLNSGCTAAYKGVRCQMSQTRDSVNFGMKVSLTRLIKIIIVYRFYLKKKRSAQHDAHVVPAWRATQDELVKIMDFVPSYSVQGALNHRYCVCRCWFLIVPISLTRKPSWKCHGSNPSRFESKWVHKHPTESYPLQLTVPYIQLIEICRFGVVPL